MEFKILLLEIGTCLTFTEVMKKMISLPCDMSTASCLIETACPPAGQQCREVTEMIAKTADCCDIQLGRIDQNDDVFKGALLWRRSLMDLLAGRTRSLFASPGDLCGA